MTVGAEEQAEARREIAASAVMLVAALAVLLLAMRGTFSAMWHFPLIFAVIMAVLAIVSLRKARGVLWKQRLLLAVAIIALSALAPALHPRGVLRKMEAYEQRASAALSGTPAPAIPFVRSIGLGDGGAGSLAPGGEPTLINFWATWCGPCVDELPMIERFWKDHRDSGLDVVGVTKLYDGPDADGERGGQNQAARHRKVGGAHVEPFFVPHNLEGRPGALPGDGRFLLDKVGKRHFQMR